MNKKYKLLLLKSILLSGIVTSFINSDFDYDFIKKDFNSLTYNNFNLNELYNSEELKKYDEETLKLTVFLVEITFTNGVFWLNADEKIKVYKK